MSKDNEKARRFTHDLLEDVKICLQIVVLATAFLAILRGDSDRIKAAHERLDYETLLAEQNERILGIEQNCQVMRDCVVRTTGQDEYQTVSEKGKIEQ